MDATWQWRGYGTEVGRELFGRRLTHIAFADDVTLVARSWVSLKRMIALLRDALKRRGLDLHPSKCKVQTNMPTLNPRGNIAVDDALSVNLLPEGDGLEILGTILALKDCTAVEIRNRVAVGWRRFWSLKLLVQNRSTSLKKRLKLFDATIGSSVLWCCQSWTPRSDDLAVLRTARNAMLRRICDFRRRPDEDWLDWMKRATQRARNAANKAGIREWVQAHAAQKWSWAGHVGRRASTTWLWRVTSWRDSEWGVTVSSLGCERPLRPSRRRWMKWEDALRRYCEVNDLGAWIRFATNKPTWMQWQSGFAEWFSGVCVRPATI